MSPIPFYDAEAIASAVSMDTAIGLMRDAFTGLTRGEAVVPLRINMPLQDGDCALVMPVYLPGSGHYGVKTVSVNHGNPGRGRPRLHAVFTLFDALTGQPLAAFDAEYITALRTGAGAGLATELLAAPGAHRLALFGAGHQAVTQLAAMASVRKLSEAVVFARSRERAQHFAGAQSALYPFPIRAAACADELRNADLVCTATSSAIPVLADGDLASVVHINGVGSYHRGMAEVPAATVARALLVVDQRSACLAEAGDITQAIEGGVIDEGQIYAELGELTAGQRPLPEAGAGISFFKSVGNAVQDLAVASHAWRSLTE
ncbi:ornithine cyclodeaminase family protein [Parahaliea aestuarii]|uniref:Ornithine cyclodeaminase family protein n=1 Tax=Parahaliea aestuarii TaxID=1852021 RepID=A0A5C8ZY11_9GAMM|nr:ornithine cyclodeaminase family protein [Parahaliea aestuarii]TXS92482.1 ornithine cyclodeaminase family protein [Parahaliea aestuarii]